MEEKKPVATFIMPDGVVVEVFSVEDMMKAFQDYKERSEK